MEAEGQDDEAYLNEELEIDKYNEMVEELREASDQKF